MNIPRVTRGCSVKAIERAGYSLVTCRSLHANRIDERARVVGSVRRVAKECIGWDVSNVRNLRGAARNSTRWGDVHGRAFCFTCTGGAGSSSAVTGSG